MSAQQPKALQLADCLETDQEHLPISRSEIAAELRRLHTETANQQDWYTEWQKWEHASKNFERQRDELLEALRSVWLWMENQADGQSKGGHATFDLMLLREQREIASAAIAKAIG